MGWNHIIIEGFCFGEAQGEAQQSVYPCGQKYPTVFCLENGHCPHFAYSKSTERGAAFFVPLGLILKDRFISSMGDIWNKLEWLFWGQLWFNRRKLDEFFKNIPIATREDCTEVAKWEDFLERANRDFVSWLQKSKDTCTTR